MSREQVPAAGWILVRTRYRRSRPLAGSAGFWQIPHLRFRDAGSLPVLAADAIGRRRSVSELLSGVKEAAA